MGLFVLFLFFSNWFSFILFNRFGYDIVLWLKIPRIIVASGRQRHHEPAGSWHRLQHSVASGLLSGSACKDTTMNNG